MTRRPRVGLALGGGAARGWSHVGVITALERMGIHPDIVCGTSSGALVGAAYAAGELERFERWVLSLGMTEVISLLDMRLSGGMFKGSRVMEYFRRNFVDRPIEELNLPFAAVATGLHTGAEVWLREGSTVDAVRASIALPAILTPVMRDGVMLVDGGLVNPVPVSLARAMGADIVIAVDLNSDILGRHQRTQDDSKPAGGEPVGGERADSDHGLDTAQGAQAEFAASESGFAMSEWFRRLQGNIGSFLPVAQSASGELSRSPSVFEVIAASINIMQVRITRSRMAGDPPDAIIAPKLAHFGLFDFHRGREAIKLGRRAVDVAAHSLRELGCGDDEAS